MVAGLFSILLVGGGAIVVAVACSRKPWKSPDSTGWQTGDIFFSAGNSWKSLAVRVLGGKSEEGSTHCGIVVMEQGRPLLVHMSTDKGTIAAEEIEEYARLNDVSAVTVRRLRELPDTAKLRGYIDYLRAARKRFDYDFNHKDTAEYYCTEFVVHALRHAGQPILVPLLKEEHIYPSQIEDWPGIERIEPAGRGSAKSQSNGL